MIEEYPKNFPKTIEDIISRLSPEEKEKHKDLIEECLQRDLERVENTSRALQALKEYIKCLEELNERSQYLQGKLYDINLMSINKDKLPSA